MIPPIPDLQDYGLSADHGFLPNEDPLDHLSSSYYNPWEAIAENLPALSRTKRIRRLVDDLPLLDTLELKDEAEWRRAYVILGFLTHAYIWGGDEPSEVHLDHLRLQCSIAVANVLPASTAVHLYSTS